LSRGHGLGRGRSRGGGQGIEKGSSYRVGVGVSTRFALLEFGWFVIWLITMNDDEDDDDHYEADVM
jgi:hypothetical protein